MNRAAIIKRANELIANAPTPEARKDIFELVSSLLLAANEYNGFNYTEWIFEGGYERWKKDGCPEDNSPYFGDQTRRFFY